MDKQREDMFDAMIRIAGRNAIQQDAENLAAEDEPDVAFSPRFERKMRALIRKTKRKPHPLLTKTLRIAAVCVAIITIATASAFALSPSFRNAVIQRTGISANFTFTDVTPTSPDGIRPGYVPEGFAETDFWEDEFEIDIRYRNETTVELIYTRDLINGFEISIDSEHSDYSTTMIQGVVTHIFVSNAVGYPSYVLFNDNTYSYLITGEIAVDELIKMANSIPIKK